MSVWRQACDRDRFAIINSMQLAAHGLAPQNDDKAAQVDVTDFPTEFHALVSGCGIYGLARARIVLTGSDRSRWLNGMVTNNVRDLQPGHGIYSFLLNPQGRIQGDLFAFNDGERLIVQTERAQAETILQIFDRYIIMDDRSEE